jgi:hypothetical protein
MAKTYLDKLKNPKWQKKRLEILNRDKFECQSCYDTESMLVVHHRVYEKGCEPWEYDNKYLVTLCEDCHTKEHEEKLQYESLLLKEFYLAGFFADDLRELASGLNQTKRLVHIPGVVSSAFAFAFKNKDMQEVIVDMYFKHLEDKKK